MAERNTGGRPGRDDAEAGRPVEPAPGDKARGVTAQREVNILEGQAGPARDAAQRGSTADTSSGDVGAGGASPGAGAAREDEALRGDGKPGADRAAAERALREPKD